MPTVAELLLANGRNRSDSRRRQGEISAQMWMNLANIAGQTGQAIVNAPGEQRRQEMADRTAQLQLENAEAESSRNQRLTRADQALLSLMEMYPDGPPVKELVNAGYNPQQSLQIAQGFEAFKQLTAKQQEDPREAVGRLAVGLKGLSPALQQSMWQSAIRPKLIEVYGEHMAQLPEQVTPELIDASIGWATGKAPETPAGPTLTQVDPTKDLYVNGKLERPGVAPPAEPKLDTRALNTQLADAIKRGDMQAANAIRQAMREESNLTRDPNAGPRTPIWVMKDGKFIDLAGVAPPGSQPANTREQGRPITSGDANRIADFDTSLDDVNVLETTVTSAGATGPLAQLGAAQPDWLVGLTGWTGPKERQAVIDRVKQVIGKALEGGVLRKEDEYKYEKILPTIRDDPKIVTTKLAGLRSAITQRRSTLVDSLEDAGYDVGRTRQRGTIRVNPGGTLPTGVPQDTRQPPPSNQPARVYYDADGNPIRR